MSAEPPLIAILPASGLASSSASICRSAFLSSPCVLSTSSSQESVPVRCTARRMRSAAPALVATRARAVAASAVRRMDFMGTPASELLLVLLQLVLGRCLVRCPPEVDDATGLAACKRHGPRQMLHHRVAQ